MMTHPQGTGKRTGCGPIADLDQFEDEIVFTMDVTIVDMNLLFDPMPYEVSNMTCSTIQYLLAPPPEM